MNIAFKKDFPEETGAKIISAAIILNEAMGTYKQTIDDKDFVVKSDSLLVIPVLEFSPIDIVLKSGKSAVCHTRFVVYAQTENKELPCPRFIHKERCTDKITWIRDLPKNLLHATFKEDKENILHDIFLSLIDDYATTTSFFYGELLTEGETTFSIGIVNEYGDKNNPICITTSYFSIKGK